MCIDKCEKYHGGIKDDPSLGKKEWSRRANRIYGSEGKLLKEFFWDNKELDRLLDFLTPPLAEKLLAGWSVLLPVSRY